MNKSKVYFTDLRAPVGTSQLTKLPVSYTHLDVYKRQEQDSAAAAIVIEEESASADGSAQVLETGIQTGIEAQDTEEISADEIYLEAINSDGTQTSVTAEPAVALDHTLLVNGQPVPADTGKTVEQGTTYVALAAMAQTLDPSVTITWDGGSSTAAVQSAVLDLTAKVGQQYLVANGRYLYVLSLIHI